MFRNHLIISLRNLLKKKGYSLINMLGLAVGIAGCLLIVLFIQHEFSYDKFVPEHHRIYRMSLERIYPNHSTNYAIVPHSFAAVAKENYDEIEEATIASRITNQQLTYVNEQEESIRFDEDILLSIDSSFLNVFNFKILAGNKGSLLTKADEIVITEDFAKRYFGATDPLGKVLKIGDDLSFTVSAVIEDLPENTHFKFSALLSIYFLPLATQENYTSFSAYTYFKLKEHADPAALEAKIPKLVDIYAAGQIERELGKSWEEY